MSELRAHYPMVNDFIFNNSGVIADIFSVTEKTKIIMKQGRHMKNVSKSFFFLSFFKDLIFDMFICKL